MKSLEIVIDALTDHGSKLKRYSATKYQAQCPSHDDRMPSLSIEWKDGTTVLNCHAGCEIKTILDVLDLTFHDLFDTPRQSTGEVIDIRKYMLANATTGIDEHPAAATPNTIDYIYENAEGEPAYKTVKTITPDGKKTFRQWRMTETGWVIGLNGETPPLYRLPEIIDAINQGHYIVICEGEKDADTFNQQNMQNMFATTSPMGAGKWREQHTQQLQGATGIYIIHDNDEPGINHAIQTQQALNEAGLPVRVLTPAAGKDLTDHIDAGYTIAQLIDADEQFAIEAEQRRQERIKRLTDEEIEKQTAWNNAKRIINDLNASTRYQLPAYQPTLTAELLLEDEPTQYLIDQLWPTGANISLTATYKAGKTSTINNIIKALADGLPLFGHFQTFNERRIGYWNHEVAGNQMRRWLREVDIDNQDRITLLNLRGHTWPLITDYVIKHTIDWLQTNNIGTWIIDPLARAFIGSGDENSNQDVGIFLDTLDYIKDQAGVQNLLIAAHTGRNAEQGNSRARGASRFDDWVDARWMLTKDADGQRWFTADGRDVTLDESRLDWDETNRTQKIAIGIGKKQTTIEQTTRRVYQIILNAMPTGINKTGIINAYKAAYDGESLSNESTDAGILGTLQTDGLIFMEKIGNSKLFKVTNNQYRLDVD